MFISGLTATAQVDRSKQPEPGPAPQINIGTPEIFTLKNGLKVIVVENHKLPRVAINLSLDNPPVSEGDKVGISSIMSGMLGKGSKSIPKDDYNEEVDYLGASVSFGASSAAASGLSKYSARILELMADAAIHPNLTQAEFKTEQAKEKENLKSTEKSVTRTAAIISQSLAYGKNTAEGEFETQASLDKVSLKDVTDFYSKMWTPQNAYLVVVGDVKFKDIKKQVTKDFGEWKSVPGPAGDVSKAANLDRMEINFVDMSNAVQSEVAVENLVNLKMGDADYLPAVLANQILGGGGEARLFRNLREDKAYTYGAYSNLGSSKYGPSIFKASASVRNMVTDSSVVAFLDEIQKFRKEPISDDDLKNAKARYVGGFVRSLEQPATIARFALNIETQNLPDDYYKNYLSRINVITKEQVQDAAKKYFMLDNARIVVVGKAGDVLKNLKQVQFEGKSIPVTYYDTEANKVEEPKISVELPADVTAATVLQHYVDAIGGKDKLEAITSILINAGADIQGQKLDMTLKKTAKNQFMQEVSMMGNVMSKQVFDGSTGYIMAQGQKIDLQPEQISALKAEATLIPELDLLKSGSATLERADQMNGEAVYVIKFTDKKTAYYAVESGLKLKEETVVEANGQTMTQPMEYSDYKAVDGIMFPYVLSTSFGPQQFDFTVSEIKINKEVSDADFE